MKNILSSYKNNYLESKKIIFWKLYSKKIIISCETKFPIEVNIFPGMQTIAIKE